MKLNLETLEVERAEFFEAVIHSKRRFNYDGDWVTFLVKGVSNFTDAR